jgi:polysaccharide chain length determinant protein (PEP-CTERM system associated)
MREQLVLIYSHLHGIWQYRWVALMIACVIAIIGWAVVYTMPNKYTSSAVVHVDTTSVMKPLLKGLSVDAKVDEGLNIMSRVLLSRKNLLDVILHTDMNAGANTPEELDELVRNLGRSIVLTSGGKRKRGSSIYELSYEGQSPELAYQVVSKLLNTLIENTLNSSRTDTASAQQFIDGQIAEYETRLTEAEQMLAEFKRKNLGFMPDEKGGYYKRLQSEERALSTIRSDLRLARRKHTAMLRQLEGETPLLSNSSYAAPKVQKLRQYREELEQLLTQYKEQHPDVVALQALIAETAESIANGNTTEKYTGGSKTGDSVEFNPVYQDLKAESNRASIEVETLNIKLAEQENIVKELKQAVNVLPGVEAKLAKLNRDYEITRERYLSFVERRESARLAQAVGQSGNNVKFNIIDAPRVPLKPSGPYRSLLLTAVFASALLSGLAWGFFKYLIQPTFIGSNQVSEKIGLPVLGSVGLYLTDEHKRKRKLQLVGFLMVLFLLVATYGASIAFRDSGGERSDVSVALNVSEMKSSEI